MRSQRLGAVVLAVALVASACGGGSEPSAVSPTTTAASETPELPAEPPVETSEPGVDPSEDGTTATSAARPAPDPDREIAPDFTLALSDGSTFVLSEEARPVFMVFWAEW